MAKNFSLTDRSTRLKHGCGAYLTYDGKVALMFLNMYTEQPEADGTVEREYLLPVVL